MMIMMMLVVVVVVMVVMVMKFSWFPSIQIEYGQEI